MSEVRSGRKNTVPGGNPLYLVFADAFTLCGRTLAHWKRQPAGVAVQWFFPVMIMLMFGYLFGGAIQESRDGSYFEFMMPGIFAMTMLFGLESTLVSVNDDVSKGITDRFRVMPIHGASILLGRSLAGLLDSAVGLLVLALCGLIVGWRWHLGAAYAFGAFGLLLLLRFSLLWVGIYLGLMVRSAGSVSAVQILVWPFSFLTNIFVDPSTMPPVLASISEWNPVSATVTAVRQLFGNPVWTAGSWPSRHALLLAASWPVIITLIFFPLAVRRYRRLGR